MSHITVVLGGGAAGFFAAIHAASTSTVHLYEKTNQLLSKVRISGGGRCNVTHACFEPAQLVQYYPRGNRELLGPFTRFQPRDTMHWFESHGVPLKIEKDGRVFPTSNSSQSIIDCLTQAAKEANVQIHLQAKVVSITKEGEKFLLTFASGEVQECDRLILATGSNPQGHAFATALGHTLVPSVPSLFTFNVPTSPLLHLSGAVANPVEITLEGLVERGPLLITHFGFSGPVVLKLSAWGARLLHAKDYKADFIVNWVPDFSPEKTLLTSKETTQDNPFLLPKKLWRRLLERASIPPPKKME